MSLIRYGTDVPEWLGHCLRAAVRHSVAGAIEDAWFYLEQFSRWSRHES